MTTGLPKLLPANIADDATCLDAPHMPTQTPSPPRTDQAYYLPTVPVSVVYATTETTPDTAIMDTGTPGDIVGDKWLRRNPQVMIGKMAPPTTFYALGNDVPTSVGRVHLRLRTTTTTGASLTVDLPSVHILRHDAVPFLVGLGSHQRLHILVDTMRTNLILRDRRTIIHCPVIGGHMTLPPPPAPSTTSVHYTRSELGLAHRQFGHASVGALISAFPPRTFSAADIRTLKDIAQACVPCQTHVHLPRRPRYALPPRPLAFNRFVAIDAFQVTPELPKVLDITCLDTDYGTGRFLPAMRGELVFALLYLSWLSIWGCPETILTDRGPEAENDVVINGLHSMGIHWRTAPTEAPCGIGRNERHHGPVRDAFLRIRTETPSLAPDLALSMAYKARNDAPRAHGVSPTTVVTGQPPRLLIGDNAHADPSIVSRARAMQTARATMEKYMAADRLRGALSHPGTTVPYVEVRQEVWFHRDKRGWLRGTVHALDGKTVYIRRDNKIFSAHEARTKPYVNRSAPQPAPEPATTPSPPIRTHTPAPPASTPLPAATRVFSTTNIDPNSHHHPRWDTAKKTELNVFHAMDCMRAVPASEVPQGKQIFDYIWRVTYKENRGNGKPPERARFCIAGNRDWHKDTNVPTSPVTPQRAIRTLIAAAVILNFPLQTEDFLRAYLQSDELPEPIYVRIPPEAGEPDSLVWAFSRAVYGKDDAGRHFHFPTQKRYLAIPNITLSAASDTIYIWALHGALASYVDDSLNIGNDEFHAAIQTVMCQYRTHRADHGTIQFAGLTATTDATGIHCSAGGYTATLAPVQEPDRMTDVLPNTKELSALAAKLLWVARCTRPDIITNATQLANLRAPTGADARHANDTLASLTHNPLTLHVPRLDRASLQLAVYADYSGSALSSVAKRQVGYMAALTDNTNRFAFLNWASHKPSRVCRGSTAGELLALADAFAAALNIRQLLQELLARRVSIHVFTDSATAYNLVTAFKDPADLSGKNDLLTLR